MLEDFFSEQQHRERPSGTAVGIDLGTTNSVVARIEDGRARVVCDPAGHALHPSVVAFMPDDSRRVGLEAKLRRIIDPLNTIYSAKRIIGQPFRSPKVQRAITNLPYQVAQGENQEPLVITRAGQHPITDISALVVEHVRDLAQSSLGQPVTHCVITVPANFNDAQREATRRAAEKTGIEVLRILNEPTAAALAYGRERPVNQRIAVFDMGGGTFDLTLLAVRDGLYEVLATGGDPFLGGDDMDHALAEELGRRFLAEHRLDPTSDRSTRAKLLVAAEQVKMRLTGDDTVPVHISELMHGIGGAALPLETTVTRAEFERLIDPIVDRALYAAESVLADADALPQSIDEILLVGGASLVPRVRQRVEEFFGRPARCDLDPMQVVALGAAWHAQALFDPDSLDDDDEPPELLLDVTAHAVSIATAGGFCETIIDKNTAIPTEATKVFATAKDDQTEVIIKVCQGAARRYEDNELLGELVLGDIPPGHRGDIRIEVGFLIDGNGQMQVTARELSSDRAASAHLSLLGLGSDGE